MQAGGRGGGWPWGAAAVGIGCWLAEVAAAARGAGRLGGGVAADWMGWAAAGWVRRALLVGGGGRLQGGGGPCRQGWGGCLLKRGAAAG